MDKAPKAPNGVGTAAGLGEGLTGKVEEPGFLEELEGMTEDQLQARIKELEAASITDAPEAVPLSTSTPLTAGNVDLHTLMMQNARLEKEAQELREQVKQMNLVDTLERKKAALEKSNAKLEEALLTGKNLKAFDSAYTSRASATAASRARRAAATAYLSKGTTPDELKRRVSEVHRRIEAKHKGVDICIAMDLTGSMGRWIEAAKTKAVEILDIAPSKYADAITRMAFVGYRDHTDDTQFVVVDFVEKAQVHTLTQTINKLEACGGGDSPEDIAGMLKKVTELNWQSSTRLLIHFGDAPCHGSKYHGLADDSYPNGDPTGLVPEVLLEKLICNRVDYHFARITSCTDRMTGIFKAVYGGAPAGGAVFEIHDHATSADKFIEVVIRSLTSSMRRSYRGYASSSSSDAGGDAELPPVFDRL